MYLTHTNYHIVTRLYCCYGSRGPRTSTPHSPCHPQMVSCRSSCSYFLVDYGTKGELCSFTKTQDQAKLKRLMLRRGASLTWIFSGHTGFYSQKCKITTVQTIGSLLCLWDTTMQTPLPEKGLSETGNRHPDALLICHFHRQLDSSSWISRTLQSPMCREDKTLQTL